MLVMVNDPCASGVQLADSEITGGSVGALGALLMAVSVGEAVGRSVGTVVGVSVGRSVCATPAARAKVLAKISPMSARKPETIKNGLRL